MMKLYKKIKEKIKMKINYIPEDNIQTNMTATASSEHKCKCNGTCKHNMKNNAEYLSFLKEYMKVTGTDYIFKDFTEKIENPIPATDIKKGVYALNTLVKGVNDEKLKNFIYQIIIDELIIYCFNVE